MELSKGQAVPAAFRNFALPVLERFCPEPITPSDGQVVCDKPDHSIGTECSFACKDGFVLAHNGSVTCEITENGTAVWSGPTSKCETVPTEEFCRAPGSPANGRVTCDDLLYRVGTTCSFACNEGFGLASDEPISCESTDIGDPVWSGPIPVCEAPTAVVSCPTLEARPNMTLTPPSCGERGMSPGEECRYQCIDGFRMSGGAPVWVCQENGEWSRDASTPTVCQGLSPPQWLNCPSGTVVPTDHRRSTAMVSWTTPQAVDQSGSQLTVVSTVEPPVVLRIGTTLVSYSAVDEMGQHAECSFSVEIIDEEPPIFLTCPPDMAEISSSQTLQVFWDPPRVKDNLEAVSMETNSQADSIIASLDARKEVWYQASDEAGNDAYCNFTVSLKPYECPYMEPPLHGALLCESWLDGGALCAVSCQEGYDFQESPAALYLCAESSRSVGAHEWQALDIGTATLNRLGTPWPQCYKKKGEDGSLSKKSIHYFDGPCGTVDARSTLRKKYHRLFRKMDKAVPGFCGNGCTEEGVLVACGPHGMDAGEGAGGGDRLRREVDKDALLGLLAKRPAFSLESSLDADTLVSTLQEVLLNDLDGSVRQLLAPFFEKHTSVDAATVPGLVCEEGHIRRGGTCLECPVGTYHSPVLDECIRCEHGTFQNETGQLTCKACPEGTNTSDDGARRAVHCHSPCRAGTYSLTGLEPCLACPLNTFQSTEGATSCLQCSADAMTQYEGALSQDDCMFPCDAGSFSMSGYQPCIPCAPGWYQPMRGQHACLPCPDGMSSIELGASDVTSCIERASCHLRPCQHNGTCIVRSDVNAYCQCITGFTGALCDTNIDDCQEGLCMHGGTCHDKVAGYQCDCPPGFEGTNCEVDIDECQSGPCINALSCNDGINSYLCECMEGYSGSDCEEDIDECASVPCQNGATCVDRVAGFSCSCRPEFEGAFCENQIDRCANHPCDNNGTCHDLDGGPHCTCAKGFSGEHCRDDVNECLSLPCDNNATCVDGVGTFTCQCEEGYTGTNCETRIDHCTPDPCENGGTCISHSQGFHCDCGQRYRGPRCETLAIPRCSVSTCLNGGVCVNRRDGPWCRCLLGYTGAACETDIDNCAKVNCLNGGSCVDGVTSYSCDCLPGFAGALCGVNLDECESDPCMNGATCVDGVNFFTCNCPEGFSGAMCEGIVDHCASKPCLNGAVCTNEGSNYHCQCLVGYSGRDCEVDIDDCQGAFCDNGGTCVDDVGSYWCRCAVGFTGGDCEININDCYDNPCQNGGRCVDGINDVRCTCAAGFTGQRCELDIDDCAGVLCVNNGSCVDEVDGFQCECRDGFTGRFCETNIQDCHEGVCDNGGTCLDGINAFRCVCAEGFTGDRCTFNIDDCAGRPCMNGGRCVDGVNSYTCSCARGFTGTRCETNIDNCLREPCRNGGSCIDDIDSYHCDCKPGYTGRVCEFDINECWSRPCVNKGRCKDGVNGYRCFCRRGYTGTNCELDVDDCEKNLCRNGATCVDGTNSYTCRCTEGHSGRYCQLKDYCAFEPCLNSGICETLEKGYHCTCPSNFRGLHCETLIPPCENHNCTNGGTCEDKPEGPARCLCADGFTGALCETAMNFCASRPCQNEGSCTNDISDYLCDCLAGFTGRDCEMDINECQSGPCQHNATCHDLVNGYRCECADGYSGTHCDVVVNPCKSSPCRHGGVCEEDVSAGFRCSCQPGYYGDTCEIQDVCHAHLCLNGGSCQDQSMRPVCICRPGYTSERCGVNIDDCVSMPCQNGGSCRDGVNGYRCACLEGFIGAECQINVDDCRSAPCDNGAACVDRMNDYSCLCLEGFTGKNCEVDIDDCSGRPCRNGGLCVDGVNDFQCQCRAGFVGKTCETNVDDCLGVQCRNGGSCIDYVEEFFCQCVPGFTGALCEVDMDDCSGVQCGDGGTCLDGVGAFVCQCAAGFTGTTCEINIDDCQGEPCRNGALCVDAVDGFVCRCLPGFAGGLCHVDIDECDSNPCQNGGQCLDGVDGYSCTCEDGFEGVLCESDINECESQPCQNGGTCLDLTNHFECRCLSGYTGSLCETNADDCASAPCQNGGRCIDGVNSFSCVCSPGFTGPSCGINIDDCDASPCVNGGRCMDGVNAFNCVCPRGFAGHLCQVNIDDCISQPCKNRGSCVDGVDQFTCTCPAGFTGVRCQTNINECQSSPCQNRGRCLDGPNTFWCRCPRGFAGRRCEVPLDDCFSRPCQNGGKCVDGNRNYSCTCVPGFTGKNCEVNVDECASAPCLNEGICHDDVNSYMCECPDGFTGLTCEINFDDCASSPCLNGAECQDLPRGFSCYCQDGYRGNRCEEWISPCDSRPCQNDGRCIPSDRESFHCLCRRGYRGVLCEEDIDDCLEHMEECMNGAVCEDRVDGFVCRCAPGYSGGNCQLRLSSDFDLIFGPSTLPVTNLIHLQPDLHELTLSLWIRPEDRALTGPLLSYVVYNEPSRQSTTEQGTMNVALSLRDYGNLVVQVNSQVVETNFMPEGEADWHHIAFTWKAESGNWRFYFDGSLRRQGTGLQTGRFIPGGGLLTLGREHDGIHEQEETSGSFVGRLSQVNIWQFAMSDAEILSLYGSCGAIGDAVAWPQALQDRLTVYRRQPSQICRKIDDCASSPCRNGATCRDLVHNYTCDCADGFEGHACQAASTSCKRSTCLNGGLCHDGPTGPVCQCIEGFTGPRCEVAMHPCEQLHCRNGGSCDVGEGNMPLCTCPVGFRGPVCNLDVNECLVQNGGCDHACVNTRGSYRCDCSAGFVLQSDGKSCADLRHCRHNGIIRQANEDWEEGCTHCQCVSGKATCMPVTCSVPVCPKGQTPVREPGFCCPICSAYQAKHSTVQTISDDMASCTVDPQGNFESFDFHSFRFYGNCRYTMAQDCSTGSFSVHLELEHKNSSPTTETSQKIVFIYLNGVKVELVPQGVKVDGRPVTLPFAISDHLGIQIYSSHGDRIKVVSGKGLEVSWGMDGGVEVSVQQSFRRQLCGLCGNFNGRVEDDSLTKHQLPSRSMLEFIHSWKVNGYEHCFLSAASAPEALSLPRQLVGRLPACASLTYRTWREVRAKCDVLKQATFAKCRGVVDPRRFYELCQQDACVCGGNEPCYCEAIAAYAQECKRNGIIVREWRNSTICGIDCPETMIFDDCGPPCLETCYNTAQLRELCRRLPCVARCQCPAGFAFHEGRCILSSACPNLVGSTRG
ncbi:fibrillin-1-like [Acanthaster planci]|uniref:Fibrillin-1-like n=1 Tax=Acanthaster planci TaxID=133434 RepID=A0A8B7Y0S9_ACAPL|nr:fibrillin-1-like [Acanthaster planci]